VFKNSQVDREVVLGQSWEGGDELLRMCKFVTQYDHSIEQESLLFEKRTLEHVLCLPADELRYKIVDGSEKLTVSSIDEDEERLSALVGSRYESCLSSFGTISEASDIAVDESRYANSIAMLLRGKYGLRKDTPLDREMGERAAREMLREVGVSNVSVMSLSVMGSSMWLERTVIDRVCAAQRISFQ